MAKLILMKNLEVSSTEEKRGKQIAVKENNITSLKNFYKQNYIKPQEQLSQAPELLQGIEPVAMDTINPIPDTIENPLNSLTDNNIITPSNEAPIAEAQPIMTPNLSPNPAPSPSVDLETPQVETEELDPELKEIEDRFQKVIRDLNEYKKKIKILETEANANLEKSREVLKDTQAAAQIMSIQQERQKQINQEPSPL